MAVSVVQFAYGQATVYHLRCILSPPWFLTSRINAALLVVTVIVFGVVRENCVIPGAEANQKLLVQSSGRMASARPVMRSPKLESSLMML
jgi:hypothetical protein